MSGKCLTCGEHCLDCRCNLNWIKVIDRLPEENEKFLAICMTDKNKIYNMRADGWFRDTIYSCRFYKNKFIIESHGPEFRPTHWMPLPDAPKDEE